MRFIEFEWSLSKAKTNLSKHSVSFEEAKTVFLGENARVINDPEHSEDEDRFVILGLSARLRVLVVCHRFRNNDDIIRIISARKANRNEIHMYGDYQS